MHEKIVKFILIIFVSMPAFVWVDMKWHLEPDNILMDRWTPKKFPSRRAIGSFIGYIDAVNKFYREEFGFRKSLIFSRGLLSGVILRSYPQDRVRWEKDDWIFHNFFSSRIVPNQETISAKVEHFKATIESRGSFLKKMGVEYFVLLAPSKQFVYDFSNNQGFPDTGNLRVITEVRAELCKIENVICPISALRASPELVYYKRDLHWNQLGAKVASDLFLERVGFKPIYLKAKMLQRSRESDLARIAAVLGWFGKEDEPYFQEQESITFDYIPLAPGGDFEERHLVGKGKVPLLIFHDSFGVPMIRYLGLYFSRIDGYETPLQKFEGKIVKNLKPSIVLEVFVDAKLLNRYVENPNDGF